MSEPPKYRYHFRDGKLVKNEASNIEFPEFLRQEPHPLDNASAAGPSVAAANDDVTSKPALYNQSLSAFSTFSGPSVSFSGVAEATSQRTPRDNNQYPATQNNGGSSDGLHSPGNAKISRNELFTRDNEAVQYTKSLLAEGDTLVYIKYPSKCYDSTGFAISEEPQRVHSSLLLATGSQVFTDMLGPTNQYRILRRMKLVSQRPPGIRFVIDLTPPEEGDVAVDLTAELSCSLGIRLWHTAGKRCHISSDLVGGRDPVPGPSASQGQLPASTSVSDLRNAVIEQTQQVALNPETDQYPKIGRGQLEDEFQRAIKLSKEESLKPQIVQFDARDVPEYCPIRHRLGIASLLQIIEKKDQRLDSAPKIWTLFVLAKYFDCAKVVVDYIVTWMIAHPNSQFIEILPEMSCNIGSGLQSSTITRSAFCILVGEEALSLVSRSLGSSQADFYRTNQFGRHREDINEDLQTRIEYASKDFHERISGIWDRLTEERLTWFQELPEYQKLCAFEEEVSKWDGIHDEQRQRWHASTIELAHELRRFVRGLITAKLFEKLSNAEAQAANQRRVAENYKANVPFSSFGLLYRRLTPQERILTRFPWKMVRDIDFGIYSSVRNRTNEESEYRDNLALVGFQRSVNDSIMAAILSDCYFNGLMPPEAYLYNLGRPPVEPQEPVHPDPWTTEDIALIWPSSSGRQEPASTHLPIRPRADSPTVPETIDPLDVVLTPSEHKLQRVTRPAKEVQFKPAQIKPQVPEDWRLPVQSPFFNLTMFLVEVTRYVQEICNLVLDTSEVGFDIITTDTLVSLGPEFKYLPLWAGGDDDGSGGVYDSSIPAASTGPSGPGPSFHTGFSNASTPSSEFGYSERRSVNTSVEVEHGFSSHIDRRRVIADDDFHSETFSEDSEIYDRKGKGVDRSGFVISHASSAASSITMDRGYVSPYAARSVASSATADNETMSYGGFSDDASESVTVVSDGNIDDDENSMNGETDAREIEEDETWDGGDTETFDFGDGDEDIVMV